MAARVARVGPAVRAVGGSECGRSRRAPAHAQLAQSRGGRLFRVDGGAEQFPLAEATTSRQATVPYTAAADGEERERLMDVAVNSGASEAIAAAGASPFAAVIDPANPTLQRLLGEVADNWSRVGERCGGRGHNSYWPEIFELGEELLREHFPEEAEEVDWGCGFVRDDDDPSRAIDFIQRRPQGDFFVSKFHHARRCHRDVDARDYKSEGWLEEACPDADEYSYRFYNVWLSRSPLDPTCQVWEDPLLLLLPREAGAREWSYDAISEADRAAAKAAEAEEAPALSPARMLTEAIGAASRATTWGGRKGTRGTSEAGVDPYFEERGQPELAPDDAHQWVTAPFMIFDSADVWHTAGKWENGFKRDLRANHLRGNKSESIGGRVSIELRFRTRRKMRREPEGAGAPWSPLSCAMRSGIELNRKLRPPGLVYDLQAGTAVDEGAVCEEDGQ